MNATESANAFADLKQSLRAALETYSNVHRGSGQFSVVTTHLFERARKVVLEHLGLNHGKAEVIFCTPQRAAAYEARLGCVILHSLSSHDIGLPVGVRALVFKRGALARALPVETGGGTARLVSREWVIWAKAPGRFEPGTPAIVNIIAFARALQVLRQHGLDSFRPAPDEPERTTECLYHDELDPFSGQALLDRLRQTHMGGEIQVPTHEGTRSYVNLDNAASTPTFSPIWETYCEALQHSHTAGLAVIHEVKAICAQALGAPASDYDVLFTSNTTEAINIVAKAPYSPAEPDIEPVVLNTLLEHNSNELPWRAIPGHSLIRLPFDDEGFISLQEFESVLKAYNEEQHHGKRRIHLVALSGASNVLGTFSDLAAIATITHRYGARLLVDGAQLVAHRSVDMATCGIDYLVFSAHKAYAPFGAGALVARKGLLTLPQAQLDSLEASGNENTAGIAALGKALVLLQRIGLRVIQAHESELTAHALERLSQVQGLRIFGVKSAASAHFAQKGGVIAFCFERPMPKHTALELAKRGVGVRYGCHCSHLLVKRLHKIPPFLERVQWAIVSLFPQMELPGVVRASLGIENTKQDIDALVTALGEIVTPAKGPPRENSFRTRLNGFVQTAAGRVYS